MRLNLVFLLIISTGLFAQKKGGSNLDYVDPSIGGVGVILEPVRPTVQIPNSMLRVYPMKRDQIDDQISHFPLNVPSHRIAWVFSFLPVSGVVSENIWTQKMTIEKEVTRPYYYSVLPEDQSSVTEFAPAERSGIFRIQFKTTEDHFLRLSILNRMGNYTVVDKRTITGEESFHGMKAYVYAETDKDIEDVIYKNADSRNALLAKMGATATAVNFRYGISYISIEQAKYNLRQEINHWDLNLVKNKAYAAWDKVLARIQTDGGSLSQKKVFYTSLYRCYERMVNINEYGKYYSGYDHKVHTSDAPFYVDNWLWDTYIALEPLHMILDPEKEQEKIRSYITMYEQTGWMPSFSVVFGDWPAMTGNNAAIWMADAWHKGLRNFNVERAYEGIRKGALESTILPWNNGPLTSLDSFYNQHGYMPGLRPGEVETERKVDTAWEKRQAVSVTIDNSYSDWCIAKWAASLQKKDDHSLFLKRAENYKKVFRADKGFVWPKDKNGEWIEPFNPSLAGREYFTEINAYTFNWCAKHDFKGLFNLMGGIKQAEAKLDNLYRADIGLPRFKFWRIQPDASGLTGQFVMGNEPSLHIPYLYNYTGSPWKTQKRIRMLLDTWFPDNLFGMPGDEDGGGMSAFVVLSMMGFFQVTQGVPVYTIGSPVFNKVSILLPDGKKFTIKANGTSSENKYIQKATLNGKPLEKSWFTHNDLTAGATLEFWMGNTPNKEWGAAEHLLPPGALEVDPSLF